MTTGGDSASPRQNHMQSKNTSDVPLYTDTDQYNLGRKLHAKLGAQHASCWSVAPLDVRLQRGLPVRVAFALRGLPFG